MAFFTIFSPFFHHFSGSHRIQVTLALDILYAFPGLDGALAQSCLQVGFFLSGDVDWFSCSPLTYGKIWENMGTYGKIWENMGKYWKIWENMGKYGKIWEHMGKYGKIWENMGKYGKIGKDGNIGKDLKYIGKDWNSMTGGFYRNISYKWRIFYHSMDPNSSWDNLANKLGHHLVDAGLNQLF